MDIILYSTNTPKNHVRKELSGATALTGTLRDYSSVTDPVILVDDTDGAHPIVERNYMYIADFKRYYYITDITSDYTHLWTIHAHVDVLMSFWDEISACDCVCARSDQSFINYYLPDTRMKYIPDVIHIQKKFSAQPLLTTDNNYGANDRIYVLLLAGSS